MIKVSICIPTYNRAKHLENCLYSIIENKEYNKNNFQICISDNASTDETYEIVKKAQQLIEIDYRRNKENIGIPRNFLNVVNMADGDFIWLIGDDDLLLPDAFQRLDQLISSNPDVDFFYVNSFHLSSEYVLSYQQPFNSNNLPKDMEKFSNFTKEGKLPFLSLVSPSVSFDFLGGMFLSVFRRQNWQENSNILDEEALFDTKTFSHFDNTFPHIKIFAYSFSNSIAYFNKEPLNVCLTGVREWEPMYNFVKSIRLVEALEIYKENGLPYLQYLRCKNYALRTFLPNLLYMFLNKETSGYKYISLWEQIRKNFLFPNFYLSVVYYFYSKLKFQITGKY